MTYNSVSLRGGRFAFFAAQRSNLHQLIEWYKEAKKEISLEVED